MLFFEHLKMPGIKGCTLNRRNRLIAASCSYLSATSKLVKICILVIVSGVLGYTLSKINTGNYEITNIDQIKQPSMETFSRSFLASREISQNFSSVQNSEHKKQLNCSVLDFLTTVDKSARSYDPDLVCDEFASKSDIFCRIYLRQIGLEHLESNICSIKSLDKVPKIVYYVIFGVYKFRFLHYISIMSAKRFISPSAIYLIGDQHPVGHWWQKTLRDIRGVRFLYREAPKNISGISEVPPHHLSDIVRFQAVYMNGGIYLDADMVIFKDLEPILDFDISLGLVDNGTGMGNAFIAAKRGSQFLKEWYSEYMNYKRDKFYWNSLKVPQNMWLKNKSRVNMLSEKLYRPSYFQSRLLYNQSDYNWRNNYGMHMWSGPSHKVPESLDEIVKSNTTFAKICRYVLYGHDGIRNETK